MWEAVKAYGPQIRDWIETGAITFAAVVAGLALWRLPRMVEQLKDINGILQSTLKQIIEVQRKLADQPDEKEVNSSIDSVRDQPGNLENWERIKELWGDVRDFVETKVDNITDRRVARRYDAIPRYSYRKVVEALVTDQLLDPKVAKLVIEMNNRFLGWKTRARRITSEVVQQFDQMRREILELP